jgi:hypothetical protein
MLLTGTGMQRVQAQAAAGPAQAEPAQAEPAQAEPDAAPRHSTQRLYLKDGSYQTVTEYHLAGDHVHYYSADRAQWEDVPTELVDLPKTQKWNAERDQLADQQRAARNAERAAADAEIRKKLDEQRPEVAEHLRLPEQGYMWGLDIFHGKPELLPMVQPAAEAAAREKARSEAAGQDKKLRKNPSQIAANEATARAYVANAALQPPMLPEARKGGSGGELHLEGTGSRREFHVTAPVFYLRAGALADTRFVLIRMEQDFKHQERRMSPPSMDALTGGSGKGYAAVKVQAMPGGYWLKISIPAELPIGEYALVRILGPAQWDEHVWDFGVNPRGFENGEAISPDTQP